MPATDMQKAELLADRTQGYQPQSLRPSFLMRGLPSFTLWQARAMQDDDAVRLGLAIKLAPHTTAKLIAEGSGEVQEFAQKTIETIWANDLPRILTAFSYTRCVAEVLYRYDRASQRIVYGGMREFDPADANLLLRNNEQYGLRVNVSGKSLPVDLTPPKAFSYVHGREFNGWEGRSELAGAYEPWLEKTDRYGGAKESRRRFMHTRAFHGGIARYPVGSTITEDGLKIPNIDIMRTALEQFMNGGCWFLPNNRDEKGNYLWDITLQGDAHDGSSLINYVDKLSVEIWRGMGIPDDIVVQTGDGGSYAGRRIPLIAFFKSELLSLRAIVSEVKRQIVDPLVYANFGAVDYSISAEIDESVFEPKETAEPALAPRAGGIAKPGGNPGQQTQQLSEFKESEHPRDEKGRFAYKHDAATGRVNGYDFDPPGAEPRPLAGDPKKIVKREPEIGGRAMREWVRDMIGAKPEDDSEFDKAEFIEGLRFGNDVPDDFLKNAERARYRIETFLEDFADDNGDVHGEDVYDHTNRIFHAWAPPPEEIADAVEKALNEAKAKRDEKRAARIAARKAAKQPTE